MSAGGLPNDPTAGEHLGGPRIDIPDAAGSGAPAGETNPFAAVRALVVAGLRELAAGGSIPHDFPLATVTVEPARDRARGEIATNAALVLARPAGLKPMPLAGALAPILARHEYCERAEVATPGFVNLTMRPEFWRLQVRHVLAAGADYGRSAQGGSRRVNVEFCSANPTGPLHVGHGRGTVFGDALASVLTFAGYDVSREYYVNDAGAQIEVLARSIHHRYLEALGEPVGPLPDGFYPGAYLVPVAETIARRDGPRWRGADEGLWLDAFAEEGLTAMLALIRDDLAALGVRHDVYTSERDLVASGRIDDVLARLEAQDLVYTGTLPPPKGRLPEDWEPAPQLLFRTTAYGDDVDRPLKRANGSWAYIAPDVAYHWDKIGRGFGLLIDVLGADHGGYVKRLEAAVRALSAGEVRLDVRICQLVNLLDEGRPIKMSKRAGRIVTLRDVVDEVGRDVVRFMMLTRKNDAPLDFDLTKVTEQSKDNPVFYVQYAHARICSVFRRVAEEGPEGADRDLDRADLGRLAEPAELELLRVMAAFPRTVEGAAASFEPHRIAFYLQDLAGAFHALWTRGNEDPAARLIQDGDVDLTRARLAMAAAVRQTMANGLGILGVEPAEELR